MADTVETATSLSSADEAEASRDAPSVSQGDPAAGRQEEAEDSVRPDEGAKAPEDGIEASGDGIEASEEGAEAREEEAEASEEGAEAREREAEAREEEAEAREEEAEASEEGAEAREREAEAREEGTEAREEGTEAREEETEPPEDGRSLTEMFEQLGRELGELGMAEAQLEAARNMPEVRRSANDVAGALVVVIAGLTAFAFANVAAMDGLSKVLATWLAALVLAVFWIAVGGVLLFGVMGRARQWLSWIVLKSPPNEAVEELERQRDAAGRVALGTIQQLGPAIAIQIALAAVPKASDVAGDMASGVVDAGDSVLEASDEIVEVITEQIPGGGVVNQVWDVALMPGRLGIKVATTVLRRGRTEEQSAAGADGRAGAPR
jgi:hypothetical protein